MTPHTDVELPRICHSVSWHISAHKLTGDPRELTKLQDAVDLLPPDSHKYAYGDPVYCLNPSDPSLFGVQGIVRGVLVRKVGDEPRYYVCFGGSCEMSFEYDLSARRISMHDLQAARRYNTRGCSVLSQVDVSSDCGSSAAEATSNLGHDGLEGHDDGSLVSCASSKAAAVDSTACDKDAASARTTATLPRAPTPEAHKGLPKELWYLLKGEDDWGRGEFIAQMSPARVGLDRDVHNLLYRKDVTDWWA